MGITKSILAARGSVATALTVHSNTRLVFRVLSVVMLSLIAFQSQSFAQSNTVRFPYQAFVLHDAAEVHSGPGAVHYTTQILSQGSAVEVYRHDPGGWCQIRPVEGSFSLVPESTLEIIGDGVGRVKANNTKAWVGTTAGPVSKPLWQVKLQADERVEVLGEVNWPHPEGHSTLWFQIAPPSGEFRWIRMSDIQLPAGASPTARNVTSRNSVERNDQSTTRPNDVPKPVQLPATQAPKLDRQISTAAEVFESSNQIQQAGLQTTYSDDSNLNIRQSTPSNNGWRQSTRAISKPPAAYNEDQSSFEDEFSQRSLQATLNDRKSDQYEPSNQRQSFDRFASADVSAPNLAREFDSMRRTNPLNQFDSALGNSNPNPQLRTSSYQSIDDLEIRLSTEMVKDPADWRMDELDFAAKAFLQSASNPNDRLRAEKFLRKIASCKQIQSGYSGSGAAASRSFPNNQAIGTGVNGDVQLGATYDAHGWLTELVRNGGSSQSSYALQDANGKITHHISPAPGMNLHRYLKKRVGIIGQRGYHSQLKLDHVTAHRIIELNASDSLIR